MGGLPSPVEAEDIWTSIWYQEAHHSTALEGNTLVIAQVEALLGSDRQCSFPLLGKRDSKGIKAN
jgi:hypothetical protein